MRKQDGSDCSTPHYRKLEELKWRKLSTTQDTVISQTTNLTGDWKEMLYLKMPMERTSPKQVHKPRNGDLDPRNRCCAPRIPSTEEGRGQDHSGAAATRWGDKLVPWKRLGERESQTHTKVTTNSRRITKPGWANKSVPWCTSLHWTMLNI